jgi:hypothetical protein
VSLKISEDLSLPREAATWVITYLAKRGAGKTYCSGVQAEEMLKNNVPIVVLDGMSTWWGLRVSSDGLHPGLPIVVFGGEHADLPLAPDKAAEMAKAIVESNISCVLDLSPFTKYVARKIVSSFLNELYRLNRVERHVFIEESDLWAPQRPIGPEENLCLSSVDNFVRRGGNHNLGCTLITQRSAVLNKDILTQSDCLVVLRTLAPQDKKAIQAWVEEQTDEDKAELKQWYDSLKTLENGQAWVWHPEKPSIFLKVKFRERVTFHATREFIRSPKAGKIVLMGVDEFVARFRKVFESSVAEPASARSTADHAVAKALAQLEEFRSGRKLPETVQKRIDFLELKEKNYRDQVARLEVKIRAAEDLATALRIFLDFKNIYDNIQRVSDQAKSISKLPGIGSSPGPTQNGAAVRLQKVTKIVSLPAAEKPVTINTDSMRGKILTVAKKGKLDQWRQLGEVVKAIEEEHWNASPQEVNNALNDLAKEDLIAKKHTDRNYYSLGQGVKFQEGPS